MDADDLRARAARTADQLAVLAATAPSLVAQDAREQAYASGVQDVARWLSSGYLTPQLANWLAHVERLAQKPPEETPPGR